MSKSFAKTAAVVGGVAALGSLAVFGAVYYYDQLRDLYDLYTAKDTNIEEMEEFHLRGAPRVAPHASDGDSVSRCDTSTGIASTLFSDSHESEMETDVDEEEVATANTSPSSCSDDEKSEAATFDDEDASNTDAGEEEEEEDASSYADPEEEEEDDAGPEGEEEEQAETLSVPRTVMEIETVPEEAPIVHVEPQRNVAGMSGDFFGAMDVVGLHEPADGVRGRVLEDAVSDRGVQCGCLDAVMAKVRRWRDSLRRRTSKRRLRQTSV